MRSPRLTTADDHALAHDLAERAGRLLLDLRAQGGDPAALKDAGDRSSHEFLIAELAKARPADAVLSEEGLDSKARLTADRVWIVDPLDGTREFGEPPRTDWAVHVALWERGAARKRAQCRRSRRCRRRTASSPQEPWPSPPRARTLSTLDVAQRLGRRGIPRPSEGASAESPSGQARSAPSGWSSAAQERPSWSRT